MMTKGLGGMLYSGEGPSDRCFVLFLLFHLALIFWQKMEAGVVVSSDSEGDTNEPIRAPCSVLGQILNDDSDDSDDDDDCASDGGHNVCFGLLFWPSRLHTHWWR
jgi:hypothetical protein